MLQKLVKIILILDIMVISLTAETATFVLDSDNLNWQIEILHFQTKQNKKENY